MNIIRYKQILKSFIPSSVMTYAIMKREHPDSSIKEVLQKTKLVRGSSKRHATNSFVKQSAKQYRYKHLLHLSIRFMGGTNRIS